MHRTSKLLNGRLASAVTTLRYGESIIVADAGLPVPPGTETLDVAIVSGLPSSRDVVAALKEACVLLEVRIAAQTRTANPAFRLAILDLFEDADLVKEVDHVAGIEAELARTRLVVQTGEVSPYGNVVLVGGLDFFDITMADGA